MSTLKCDNLQNSAGTKTVPMNTVVDGSAKAWVNFNGTGTVAIRASFNVTSITDNGVGNYTANFISPMPDANYTLVGSGKGLQGVYYAPSIGISQESVLSTTSCRFAVDSSGAARDSEYVMLAFFR